MYNNIYISIYISNNPSVVKPYVSVHSTTLM